MENNKEMKMDRKTKNNDLKKRKITGNKNKGKKYQMNK